MLGCILVAVFLIRTPTLLEESAPEVIPVTVRVAEVQMETVDLVVKSQGKVQAAQTVSLSAPVAGPVQWISPALEAGGYVEVNQVVIRLESSDFETVMARSRAAMQQAEAEARHAAAELARFQELADQRLASESQLQDSIRQVEVTKARLADAKANFNQAVLDFERTQIRPSINAIVASRDVELGQYVNRAQQVAVLYGAEEVEVRVPLAIRQLGYLNIPLGSRGEFSETAAPTVTLTGIYGGEEHHWTGRMVRTEAAIDANSNTVQSIIRVKQPGPLAVSNSPNTNQIPLPIGLFVRAEIEGKRVEELIALPRSVIRNNDQVLVIDAENKMYFRDVEIFRLEEDRVLISGGLLPGELICISPIQAVVNGMTVQPLREMNSAAAQASN
jgi:RND family efflux transporter MFP subunit